MTESARPPIDLLLVDDDQDFRETLARRFSRGNFLVSEAASADQALDLFHRRVFDVAVLDMMMPGMSGLELFQKLKKDNVETEVVFLTGKGTIETAVEAMKLGAFDYLQKPFPSQELESTICRANERRQLKKENFQLRAMLDRVQPKSDMVGESPQMQEVFRLIKRAGPSDKAVLIQGESGTGKELVARALHQHSERRDKPMVTINCAALPESLLESELFGHEKGAFTGAVDAKPGLFEVADGGTLFIDELGELPGMLQAKLLRVLEDGSLRRVGSIKERHVDVRILCATNRCLEKEVEAGRFREDLYYRINVMSLELPPLRHREGDLPLLIAHLLGNAWEIEAAAVRRLEQYSWPGNVRQLINALERGKIMSEDRTVRLKDLPKEVQYATIAVAALHSDPDTISAGSSALTNDDDSSSTLEFDTDDLARIERAKVVEVLRREQGNKSRAARSLGIERRKIYRLIEKYQISDDEVAQPPGL